MEIEVCPTEVLIDLKEDTLSSHMNSPKIITTFDFDTPDISLIDKENNSLDIKQRCHQSILDEPPSGIEGEYMDSNLDITLKDACEIQNLKINTVVNDCPTAILVDIPSSPKFCKQEYMTDNNHPHCRCEENLCRCKSVVKDLKHKCGSNLDSGSCGEDDFSQKINEEINEALRKRLHLKTPSPQSMSCIMKEASKVIHTLNSSAVFDEDSLLTEEIFPIPFDIDLEDDAEQEDISDIETSCKNRILNSLGNIPAENKEFNCKAIEKANSHFNSPDSRKFSNNPLKSPFKAGNSKMSLIDSKEVGCDSEQIFSSEIHSSSQGIPEFKLEIDGPDDVFVAEKIPSEDKENIQRREHTTVSEDTKNITPYKRSLKSKVKEYRGTLRNVSNLTPEITKPIKYSSPHAIKDVTTPVRQISIMTKSKITQPATGKLQLKKTMSAVDSVVSSKGILKYNSFHFNTTKELMSSVQKPNIIKKNASLNSNSLCKSSSSEFKQDAAFTKMKTPAKRYSVATPLKSASAMKPPYSVATPLKSASAMKAPLTPALHSYLNPSIPRYMPQSVGNSRLSFSKSWQPHSDASIFSKSKGVKPQNCTSTAVPTSASKASSGRVDSFNKRRQSFSQSMSASTFRPPGKKDAFSTSNKNRFSSKLNLPLQSPIGQERKLPRILFPSTAKKLS